MIFFEKSHETHCICKRFSIYCNKNCSGNMRILCPFAETTYAPSGDENKNVEVMDERTCRNNLRPVRGRKHGWVGNINVIRFETTYAPSGDENLKTSTPQVFPQLGNNLRPVRGRKPSNRKGFSHVEHETTYAPSGDENPILLFFREMCTGNNLRPVRGRKHQLYQRARKKHRKQLTPRQGTKTIFSASIMNTFPSKQLTPRQGTKTYRQDRR